MPGDPSTAHASPWWLGSVPKHCVPSALCHPQWVLAFEIFIPLVLFFILLGLRQKKPTIPVKEGESQQGGAWGAPTLGGTLRLWGDAPAWGQGGPREAFWGTLHWAGATAEDWWVEVAESVPARGGSPGGGSTNQPVTVISTAILHGEG